MYNFRIIFPIISLCDIFIFIFSINYLVVSCSINILAIGAIIHSLTFLSNDKRGISTFHDDMH